MNINWALKLIVTISFMALTCGVASAEYTYSVSPASILNNNGWVEMNGVYSQTVSGFNGFSNMDTNTYGDGLWASLKVKSAYCPSYCMVRLDRYVGYYNGNLLRVEFRLAKWDDNQTIEYRVREVDSFGSSIRDITRGYLGSNTGQHWTLNENVIMAVALEDNEFIFYSDNYDQIAKLQLLGPITPFQTPRAWRVNIWTETANDSMTAEVSGFLAVNVSDTLPALPSLGIVGGWAMTEYEGPNTCGDPVGAYVDSYNMVIRDTGVITEGNSSVNGFISGNTVSWTGNLSFQDDGATVTLTNINLAASSDGNTIEGSMRWSAVANGFSCSGVQNLTGIRNN